MIDPRSKFGGKFRIGAAAFRYIAGTCYMVDAEQFHQLAHEALEHYGIADAEFKVIKATNNVVYQVDVVGRRYVLRVHRLGSRKLAWIESELMWLAAIRHDTDLRVPEPAAPVYLGRVGEAPVYCTLLRWLGGEPVPTAALTLKQADQIGAFAARLHNHSAGFAPSEGFTLPRLDWNGMFSENSPYYSIEGERLFTPDQHEVMTHVAERVQKVMERLETDPGNFGVIHADLIWKNILFDGERIGAIDFDNCAFGYYLYDLAPALLGYLDEPNYPQIRQAIWEGYTSVRALPTNYSDYLETLVAGRYVLSCWWIAANRHNPAIEERASEIIAYRIGELRRYLQTGNLRRGEIIG